LIHCSTLATSSPRPFEASNTARHSSAYRCRPLFWSALHVQQAYYHEHYSASQNNEPGNTPHLGTPTLKHNSPHTMDEQDDREDILAVNRAIDHMRPLIPADPYILTIPQDVTPRYQHQYAYQERQWRENTPFEQTEHESMQYLTFHFHDPARSMFMQQSSRPKEKSDAKEKAGTGPNTPNLAPKKKISLDAYKKKQNGATPNGTPAKAQDQVVRKPASKAPVKGPVERIKADEDMLADMQVDMEEAAAPVEPKKELKRKREQEDEVKVEQEVVKKQKHEHAPAKAVPPPTKETAPDALTANKVNGVASQKTEDAAPSSQPTECALPPAEKQKAETVLPPKLSPPTVAVEPPKLPPKLSPVSPPSMPPRLSPTMPSNITKTLKAKEHYRSVSRSSDVSATGHNLTPPRHDGKNATLKKSPRNGFRANSSSPAVRSDVEERGRTSAQSRVKMPESGAESSEEITVAKKRTVPDKPTSLIVKLKFKKSIRSTVQRILGMRSVAEKGVAAREAAEAPTRPPSKAPDARDRTPRDANAKGVAQKIEAVRKIDSVKNTTGEAKREVETKPAVKDAKRSRLEDSETEGRPTKRAKVPAEVKSESEGRQTKSVKAPAETKEAKKDRHPSTPETSETSSPSALHKTTVTPGNLRKDLLSVSMKRERSTDSNTKTPSATSQSSPPDTTSAQPNGTSNAPPSTQPSSKTLKQAAWETEQKRLAGIGRDLKHAAQAHNTSATKPDAVARLTEQKLAAVKALESLLAFLLAFTSADEAALAADPKQSPSGQNWRSLQGLYSFVKKLCEPFPVLKGVACSLAVAFNARVLEVASLRGNESVTRDMLLETQGTMLRAAQEGEAKLNFHVLQTSFPITWAASAKGAIESEPLEPAVGFAGPYALPIGVQTSPLRAARAGHAMLEEWIGQQGGLGYELKLKLG